MTLIGTPVGAASSATGSTIASPSFNLIGQTLIVACANHGVSSGGSVSGITDTASNTYLHCTGAGVQGQSDFTDIWYVPNANVKSGCVATLTVGTAHVARAIAVYQVNNAALLSPFEVAQVGNNGAGGSSVTSSAFAPLAANNLNVACYARDTGAVATGGYTIDLTAIGTAPFDAMHLFNAAAGSQTVSVNLTAATVSCISVASFNPAAYLGWAPVTSGPSMAL